MITDPISNALMSLPKETLLALIVLALWEMAWKCVALWKSARLRQPIWFVVLLVVNTIGILPILYIFIFSKISLSRRVKKKKR